MSDFPDDVAWKQGVSNSPMDWFRGRMKMSGITEAVASASGIKLGVDDQGAYFRIPYYSVDAVPVLFEKLRRRQLSEGGTKLAWDGEPFQSAGEPSKYSQPKGSKSRVYWPALDNQRVPYNHPKFPLIVCEGELKAIRTKMACLGSQLPFLVCGVPGTQLRPTVLKELQEIACLFPPSPGEPGVQREVYLAFDWNEKGDARERGVAVEYQLNELFQALGARVFKLRWPVDDKAGPQKLDEWLSAGGDISEAIRTTKEEAERIGSSLQEHWDYCNTHYMICHGRIIPLSSREREYSIADFNAMEAHRTKVEISNRGEKVRSPWFRWGTLCPEDQKNVGEGVVLRPYPFGQVPPDYVIEEGKRYLNTAPHIPLDSAPWDGPPDASPFVSLVRQLCVSDEGTEWFINIIAKAAQAPMERGQHIIVFRDNGSSGKSALFSTLHKVFGKYAGEVGNSFNSQFNSRLARLLIATWSEPEIKGFRDRHMISALKGYSGDIKMVAESKGIDAKEVYNYGRLLIATNNAFVIPVEVDERRWAVFGAPDGFKWSPEDWQAYRKWEDNGGIMTIRQFLMERDLSNFNVHARAPMTAQRRQMEDASAPEIVAALGEDIFQKRDVWSAAALAVEYGTYTGGRRLLTPKEIGHQMSKGKFPMREGLRVEGKQVKKLYAVRHAPYWEAAENSEWQYEAGRFTEVTEDEVTLRGKVTAR